jgi:hypothetical protein
MNFRSPSIAFSQRAVHDTAFGPESRLVGAVRAVSARQARIDSLLLERLVPEARHLGSSRPVRRYARRPRPLRERKPGSPVLALLTLLRHFYREKLLNASEFNFLFIERDPANLAALEAELSQLKPFPARINVETSEGDAFERLSVILRVR